MDNRRERLRSAYEATDYAVDEGPQGRFLIRCGSPSADVDALLDAVGTDAWAYVTACNPGSVPLSTTENAERMGRLAAEVRDRGLVHFAGTGTGGDWPPEPSLLVLGLTEPDAVALGRGFGQLAVVVGRRGKPARLAWIDPEVD